MKVRLLALLMVSLLSLGLVAGCGGEPVGEKKVLEVGMDAAYPPFGSQDTETKEYEGFDVDIIWAIAKAEGFEVKIENRAFDGLIPALQSHDLDLAINDITVTEDRKKNVDFTKPYYIAGLGVMVRADDDRIHTAADLAGKKLGVSIGSTGEEAARKIDGAEVRVFNTINDAFLELEHGGVDAVVNDIPTNEYYVKQTGNTKVKESDVRLNREELAIAVLKGNQDLLQKLDDGLAKIKQDGQYAEIYKKWFGKEPPEELLRD